MMVEHLFSFSFQVVYLDLLQLLNEIKLKRSVYALDSAQNGRLIATAGAGTRLLISVMS